MIPLISEEIKRNVVTGDTRLQPKWQALGKYLAQKVVQGVYKPGEVLPSENYLAKSTGFARSTVRQAFSQLEKDGLVRRVQGKGTIVSAHQIHSNNQSLHAFGLIVPEIRRTLYPSLIKGFDDGASQVYHQVLICNTNNNIDKQGNIILQLLDKGISGVALVPTIVSATPLQHIRYLQANKIPVIFCHRSVKGAKAPCISWKVEDVGRIAGEAFIKNGHSKIMYFGRYRYQISQIHERSLRQVLEENGLSLPQNRVLYGRSSEGADEDADTEQLLRNALEQSDPPTAILCNDDTEAERVYWIATQLGRKVPDDLAIIGFGDIYRDTIFRKQLTSVVIDEFQLGRKASNELNMIQVGDKALESENNYYMELQLYKGCTL